MRIHLVTYAAPRFRMRQLLLGASARLNHVVDTVTSWTPQKLLRADFEDRCKDIKLSERGSGFWAWKPFIIAAKLHEIPDGDLIFYCDVGRRFPYKILDRPLAPFLEWMERNQQDFMPGLSIAWRGPLAVWTKRDAFVITGMDHPSAHTAPSVQASFSLWRAGPASRSFVRQWMTWCSDRRLVSDDPSTCGLPEYPGFHEHRHDQSLLTLTCLKTAAKALKIGDEPLPVDTRDPAQVIGYLFNMGPTAPSRCWKPFVAGVRLLERAEMLLRKTVKFGTDMPEHPLAND
jgi:hypothetical protein